MFDPKVHVGVAAVVLRQVEGQTEVLVLERGPQATHGANTWGLPGGWIDWGQTPAEAAARELLEELNVTVTAEEGELIGAVANTYDEQDMHVICLAVHFGTYDDERLENLEPEKCSAVAWMPLSSLPDVALFPPLESLAREWGWL